VNVPLVFVPFGAKVAPEGSESDASDVIESPSGSTAVTTNVNSSNSRPLMVAGALTTGDRGVSVMEMAIVAVPVSQTTGELTSVARHALFPAICTEYDPAWVKPGVQEKVPDVFAGFAAKVPPAATAEPVALNDVIASPSGSEAVTPKVRTLPSGPLTDEGAVTIGSKLTFLTVMPVVAEPASALDAVNVTL
jgi:hypothetical protein